MKELEFTKVEGKNVWVAKTAVATDFNVHLEREKPAVVRIWHNSVGENAQYTESYNCAEQAVFDHDFDARVYPKYLRIESFLPVSVGYITEVEE